MKKRLLTDSTKSLIMVGVGVGILWSLVISTLYYCTTHIAIPMEDWVCTKTVEVGVDEYDCEAYELIIEESQTDE
jgi:hypothetical protein